MNVKKVWFKRIPALFGVIVLLLMGFSIHWLVYGGGRYYFYLPYASKISLKLNAVEIAESYAYEMLETAETEKKDPCNWNYGNAIHQSHNILGRVALRRDDIDAGCRRCRGYNGPSRAGGPSRRGARRGGRIRQGAGAHNHNRGPGGQRHL